MDISEIFSVNFLRIRKTKGLSQCELAEKTGLSQRMIHYYEHNPRSLPIERLSLLANALGVRVADFFDEEIDTPLDTLDVRWIKKIQELKTLSESDRKEINQHINTLIEKSRLKENRSGAPIPSNGNGRLRNSLKRPSSAASHRVSGR
jgi:transcriptional regulator with XRE-family HTH domain